MRGNKERHRITLWLGRSAATRAAPPALPWHLTLLYQARLWHTPEHTLYYFVIKTFSVVSGNRTATEPRSQANLFVRASISRLRGTRTQTHLLVVQSWRLVTWPPDILNCTYLDTYLTCVQVLAVANELETCFLSSDPGHLPICSAYLHAS